MAAQRGGRGSVQWSVATKGRRRGGTGARDDRTGRKGGRQGPARCHGNGYGGIFGACDSEGGGGGGQSRNLLVTILIHALWNSRVFLGSFRSLFLGPGL